MSLRRPGIASCAWLAADSVSPSVGLSVMQGVWVESPAWEDIVVSGMCGLVNVRVVVASQGCFFDLLSVPQNSEPRRTKTRTRRAHDSLHDAL